MIEQYSRQAGFLLEEGATPEQVDKAMEKFGMAMGPFRMGDLAGNDVGWYIRKRRYVEKPDMRYSQDRRPAVRDGPLRPEDRRRLVRLRSRASATRSRSQVVTDMIEKHRAELGIAPRKIGDEEIVERCVYALVNEGAQIVEEGIALRASDIDMVYLTGYGFPLLPRRPDVLRRHGRPVQRRRGDEALRAKPHGDPKFWQPAPLLASSPPKARRSTT